MLTGEFADPHDVANVNSVLREIEAAQRDEARKHAALPKMHRVTRPEEPPPPWMQ